MAKDEEQIYPTGRNFQLRASRLQIEPGAERKGLATTAAASLNGFMLNVDAPGEKQDGAQGRAVAVGPRSFLTAAHTLVSPALRQAIRHDPRLGRRLGAHYSLDGVQWLHALCEVHPAYVDRWRPDDDADVMICRFTTSKPVFFSGEVPLDFAENLDEPGSTVHITVHGGAGGEVWPVRVAQRSSSTGVEVTGPPMIQPGDSGGGVYAFDEVRGWRVVGVAIGSPEPSHPQESVVCTVSNSQTRNWLLAWSFATGENLPGLLRSPFVGLPSSLSVSVAAAAVQ